MLAEITSQIQNGMHSVIKMINSNKSNSELTNGNKMRMSTLIFYILISIVVVYFLFGLLKGPIVIILGAILGWFIYSLQKKGN